MQKQITFALLLSFIIIPFSAEARHNSGGYGGGVNRSSLDDEVVEEFSTPVLFYVDMDKVTPDFGDPRGGGTRTHEGQDMLAPQGTPIVSPTEAIVIRTGKGDSAGNYVYTANPGGETFRYMHLEDVANLDSGDKLDVGDYIGTVGDTGNAGEGVYHLHFEVRDEKNEATDPYSRLEDEFTLKEKISFLDDIFDKRRDDDEYAEFLVDTFPNEFKAAVKAGYEMPNALEKVLKERGIVSAAEKVNQLEAVFETIPDALAMELSVGNSNVFVTLLQLYLIYTTEGSARNALAAAGSTGYYGPVTAAAVSAYQTTTGLTANGTYDSKTRTAMMKRDVALNLN